MDDKSTRPLRQGDVLLVPCDPPKYLVPLGVQHRTGDLIRVPQHDGRVILAYGEVTGHAHAISGDVARLFTDNGTLRMLEIINSTQLRHEEHGAIDLEPGWYQVIRQREMDDYVAD